MLPARNLHPNPMIDSLRRTFRLGLVLLAVLPAAVSAQDAPLFTTDFTPEEFAARRARVYDAIGSGSVAVIQGEPTPRGYVRFRQSNEFYYLSGIEVPHAYLLLDGSSRRATVFLPHRDARRESSEGKMLSAEDAELVRELSGIDDVAPLEALSARLGALMRRANLEAVYIPHQPAEGLAESRDLALRRVQDRLADPFDGRVGRESGFIGLVRERFPAYAIRDLSPVLDELRTIKSEAEIALIRKATVLSGVAIMEAMRSVQPGVVEREIDALARFIYLRGGAQGDAYYSLVASGPNAWYPHYHKGARTMQAGEWLLFDFAPDVGYYMSDVTRMMPVSGRFTPAQREIYGFYKTAYRHILDRIRPGVTPKQIKTEAVAAMRADLAGWKFSRDIDRKAAQDFVDGYARGAEASTTSLGHAVGMATHDVGDYTGVLRPGMVFTIEPALRIPEEQTYIRLEDLIVIRENGAEIISDFVPMEIDAIEALMAEPGLLQRYLADELMPGTGSGP